MVPKVECGSAGIAENIDLWPSTNTETFVLLIEKIGARRAWVCQVCSFMNALHVEIGFAGDTESTGMRISMKVENQIANNAGMGIGVNVDRCDGKSLNRNCLYECSLPLIIKQSQYVLTSSEIYQNERKLLERCIKRSIFAWPNSLE
jgi:hypothetical protein